MDVVMQSVSEAVDGAKNVAASATSGANAKKRQLEQYTVEATSNDPITTYYGVKQAETNNALRAGERGPTLLEDAHNREKISTFDHERIPERAVHARGVAAHGVFKLHTPIPEFTKAKVLNDTSRETPVFLRFSTVAGSRGSADTVRDVRGFAVRMYTEEGNWDIVGNNIPVFFVQDAIKFIDMVHAFKPEPDREIPQAQTAHDNAWDFMGLMPESQHMQMWQLSDRAIPRSFRMVAGFGVHSFILANEAGERHFVKFHFRPKLGVHSLVWDEALKLNGQDPDFHRRDLYDAIDAGAFPEWELGIQTIPEADEDKFEFDLLDATKIWPEELIPVKEIGTLTLNRNVDEFFPETEQVAFCTSHMVPGVYPSNDPLLQGRQFSYFDTQISRLGVNFAQIPINQPVCPVMNNLRDGQGSRRIHKGKVNYYPNRLNAPHPVPVSEGGDLGAPPTLVSGKKVRARGPKFEEHLSQAQLFFNSMTDVEKAHIISAASFELGKCEDEGVQQLMIKRLNDVDHSLAVAVAESLSLKCPTDGAPNHGKKTAFLSQINGKRQTFTAETRKIGLYVDDGFDAQAFKTVKAAIVAAKAIPAVVGSKQKVKSSDGELVKAAFTFETSRSTHFDAIVVFGGAGQYEKKLSIGRLIHAVREAYMHHKAIAVQGQAVNWLVNVALKDEISVAVATATGDKAQQENGVVFAAGAPGEDFTEAFIQLVANHRVWDRDVSRIAA